MRRFFLLVLLCGLLVALCGFLALGIYYQNNFPVNTWINGVYCTGKTIEQVNGELAAQADISEVTIVDAEGREWYLSADDLELCPDYTSALKAYMRQNATALWVYNMQTPVRVNLEPTQYRWNEGKLETCMRELGFVQEEERRETGCFVELDGEAGYIFYDGNRGRLNIPKALEYVKSRIVQGKLYADLTAAGCYEDIEDGTGDREQRALWDRLQDFYACEITYDMGAEKIPLTPAVLSTFLKTDENGRLVQDEAGRLIMDENSLGQWVEDLAARYNTCGTEREFLSSRGDVVHVKYGTYGTEIDTEAEKEYLTAEVEEALTSGSSSRENHIPAYTQQGYTRGLDDIGGTYIEVDMTDQRMYCYVDGELKLDTDVVTGNLSWKMSTPEGIYYVYYKQRDRILRGGSRPTPVDYWMAVKGGVGIHDAGWRKEFGGEIYKKNGSHGCINTPLNVMAELYDMMEEGTPVIMFY